VISKRYHPDSVAIGYLPARMHSLMRENT